MPKESKYDPQKTYGEEWGGKTYTGRTAKAAMQMVGIDPDAQRVNRDQKRDRETGRFTTEKRSGMRKKPIMPSRP